MRGHDLDKIKIPRAGQRPEVYIRFLRGLKSEAEFWDRGKGKISWIHGTALNLLRASCKYGEWGPRLAETGIGLSTSKKLRRCAKEFSYSQAAKLGYDGMRDILWPETEEAEEPETPLSTIPIDPEKPSLAVSTATSPAPRIEEEQECLSICGLVQKLTAWQKRFLELREGLPLQLPDKATLQNIGAGLLAIREVRGELDKLDAVLSGWKRSLSTPPRKRRVG